MGNPKRQLFVPGTPYMYQKRQFSVSFPSAFRQLSVCFSCYPFSLTRFGPTEDAKGELKGFQGMGDVSNSWLDRVCTLSSLRVQTRTSTDVRTPLLGIPFVPLNTKGCLAAALPANLLSLCKLSFFRTNLAHFSFFGANITCFLVATFAQTSPGNRVPCRSWCPISAKLH